MLIERLVVYGAVRKAQDSGTHWLDLDTLSGLSEMAKQKADADDARLPNWARANPVVRIARLEINEVDET